MAEEFLEQQEDTSLFELQEGGGFILLQESPDPPPVGSGGDYIPIYRPRRR